MTGMTVTRAGKEAEMTAGERERDPNPLPLGPPPGRPRRRFCVTCGADGAEFRSDRAYRCAECDEKVATHRQNYTRDYHAARAKAISRLITTYHEVFERFLAEERVQVARRRGGRVEG